MLKGLKRSGAKATSSFNKKFHKTLLVLTCQYAAIIFAILLISAGTTYSLFSQRLNRRFANWPPRSAVMAVAEINANGETEVATLTPPPPTANNVSSDLIETLLYVNGLLFILSVTLSYFFARWTLRPIREAYENQCRFLGDASHELRTPLSILYANLENELADKSIHKEQRDFANSNLEEAKRMNKIVSDLLLLSRLDEAAQTISFQAADLAALLKEVIGRLNILAKTHQVALNFDSKTPALIIKTNKDLLDQALTNFVKNAIIYNQAGGSVTLSLKQDGPEAVITVADTGVGMNKEDLDKVFERFYRVDKSRSRKTGGSGLGLAIAKEALEKIGGRIKIHSEPQAGTKIDVIVPNKA